MHPQLLNIPIFAGMDGGALEILLERGQSMPLSEGETIVREGERGRHLFMIQSGRVRIVKNFKSDREVELAQLRAGDFFGEMCILECMPRSATVQAVMDCELYRISSMAFYHLYESRPEQYSILLLNIARDLSRRLRRLDQNFAALHE